jgi:hypothetical protein
MMSTPLLNLPQTGILGMHNVIKRAVVINDQVVVRPMMYDRAQLRPPPGRWPAKPSSSWSA